MVCAMWGAGTKLRPGCFWGRTALTHPRRASGHRGLEVVEQFWGVLLLLF